MKKIQSVVILFLGGVVLAHAQEDPIIPPYRFDQPDEVFELPNRLREISGLTVMDDHTLAAIQDEDGKIFFLDIPTGRVNNDIKFAEDRDYEGIERVGDTLYVLTASGDLYAVQDQGEEDPMVEKYETFLSTKYDTEGLAYDADQHRLLIACKEFAGKDLGNQKAFYAFDLASKTLQADPVFLIDLNRFNKAAPDHALNRTLRSWLQAVGDFSGFKPSAIAQHPHTKEWYILSSVRKAVVVLDAAGALQQVWALPEDQHPQPEGLAFLPNGDVFIANEGRGDRATLLRFSFQQ